MSNSLIFFTLTVAIAAAVNASAAPATGKCAMYGNCSPDPNSLAPCAHAVSATKPSFEMQVCSQYKDLACCDAETYKLVSNNLFALTPIFGRCPACLLNLEALICGVYCSPNQADFISGIEVNSTTGSPFVQSADVAINADFGNGVYDQCVDVQFGATNMTVFLALFGAHNVTELYHALFLNNPNSLSSLVLANTDQGGLNDTIVPCNSSNPNLKCSAVDCGPCAPQVSQMRFLVGVNSTQTDCAATGRTVFLNPNLSKGDSPSVTVGSCDNGPLTYTVSMDSTGIYTINVVFYSSNIEDASPPACSFTWTGDYLPPPPSSEPGDSPAPSLLPGCSVSDSREGFHMTYYWFYLQDWTMQQN